MPASLSLEQLKKLVDGAAVAIRGKATLQSAGGPGDKVFPPTHAVEERRKEPGAKYALERRRGQLYGYSIRQLSRRDQSMQESEQPGCDIRLNLPCRHDQRDLHGDGRLRQHRRL